MVVQCVGILGTQKSDDADAETSWLVSELPVKFSMFAMSLSRLSVVALLLWCCQASGLVALPLGGKKLNDIRLLATRGKLDSVVVPNDFRLSGGVMSLSFITTIVGGTQSALPATVLSVLGLFLAFQTRRVRLLFDDEALEVKTIDSSRGADKKALADSGENWAVGGKNRWNYSSINKWFFLPSKRLPILLYFRETQTPGSTEAGRKGQLHLFPAIMNPAVLDSVMSQRVGPSA
jgi:hypothetical protein